MLNDRQLPDKPRNECADESALWLEITWALGLACVTAVLLDPKLTFVLIAQRIFANSNSFSMLAIPAFMLAGDIMSKGGLSKRLVAFADALVGWISGGISLVSIPSVALRFSGVYVLCCDFRLVSRNYSCNRRPDVP